MDISKSYIDLLAQFEKHDEIKLDRNYIVIGTLKKPMSGHATQWLWLVSRGLVHGGNEGSFYLTEDGEMVLQAERKKHGRA